ncbi:MAG: DsbA family oxidoreductase [Agriterribacter sp.]
MENSTTKMKVEIWSDIMCPFCYIGKRKFESALNGFDGAEHVEIEWHSFQLDPTIQTGHGKNLYQYLSERKGIPYQQSVEMHKQVTAMAKEAGLDYQFDKAVVANSFDAHRLIQFAKTKSLGDAAEERLFHAYFTEGKDFSNHDTLVELGKDIGLDADEITKVLSGNAYTKNVKDDIEEAAQIGVRGVPFFVFNRTFAVSGAQPSDVFSKALQQSFDDWNKHQPLNVLEVAEGSVCAPGDDCK